MSCYALLGLAAGLEAGYLFILLLGNLKARAEDFILLALTTGLLYLISVFTALRLPSSRRTIIIIFLCGLVFRATVFPLYPSLSDDLLRYRWEGKAQAAGLNPYRAAPADAEARFLRDETYPAVNGKPFTSVYGPITELVYRAAYRLTPGSVIWMKLPALVFDLGTAILLVFLLPRLGLPATRVLIYYWCPLAVVEFGASGHNDAISVFFMTAALLAAETGKAGSALTALAASALSKLYAVFLAPLLAARESDRLLGRVLLWPALLVLAAYWPFRTGLENVLPGVSAYAGHWRNNDSLFGLIYFFSGSLSAASNLYIAVVAGTSLYLAGRREPFLRGSYLVIGAILLFAANCFPWYLTWILPFLAVYVNPAWLLLTVTSALAYHVLIPYRSLGQWQETTLFRVLEYLPVYALLIGRWLWRRHEA